MAEAEGFEALFFFFLLLSTTEYTGASVAGVWGTGRKVRGDANFEKPSTYTLCIFMNGLIHQSL